MDDKLTVEIKSLRDEIGECMTVLGENENIVVVTADLMGTCRLRSFKEKYPDRFFNVGIAEQDMISFAAGLAHEGFMPYVFTMAPFMSMRACEQVRTDVAYANLNVRMIATYAGVSGGISGATHWGMEDVGIMSSIPGIAVIEFDTSNINPLTTSDDLYQCRSNIAAISDNGMDSDVTVCVQGYNRVEKTKQCVESILKYTGDVNYDLLLIDNGSTDGTFDFFKSVDFKKKRIIRIDKNVSSIYPALVYNTSFLSRYMAGVSNDLVVTPHWLSNLLRIAESDEKIGLVQPVSSNISNLQQVNLDFNSIDEMEEKAEAYNVSDPAKWEQRLRLVINGNLIKKETLYAIGWPYMDVGFYHDFADDDMTFRVRRAGYKAILARDTWICHDHDHTHMSSSDIEKGNRSIKIGRENFRNKYFGIDAWDDVNCFIPEYLSALKNSVYEWIIKTLNRYIAEEETQKAAQFCAGCRLFIEQTPFYQDSGNREIFDQVVLYYDKTRMDE